MLDIVKFLQAHRIPTAPAGSPHCGPGWVNMDCPACGDRQQWHLGFALESGAFHCWRCGGKSFRGTIGRLLRTTDQDTISREIAKYQTPGTRRAKAPVERAACLAPPPGAGPMDAQHRAYLRHRGFDPAALAREYGLLGTRHLSGPWNWRVIIPVRNAAGQTVAYQGRSVMTAAEPKYRMTPDGQCLEDPKGFLYGEDKVTGETVLVMEGATGVWRFGGGAVATFGIQWHPEQAAKLRRYKRRFILFDPEEVAQAQAMKLAEWLGVFPGETEVLSGFQCQPGEFPAALVAAIRKNIGMDG